MSSGGGKKPVSQQPKKALGIDFQGAQYGPPIPVVYGKNKVAGNCIWYGDFKAIAQHQKQSSGKGGGGSNSGTVSYIYKASYQLALAEGPISAVPTVYNGTSTTTLSALGAVLATGTSGQAAWSHLSGSAAIGYSNTAVVSFANRDLGSQASLPNDNFEVAGLKQYGGSIVDAEFSAIFIDICNSTTHGLAGVVPLGDLTQWSNYCVAAGLFVSPVYDQQDAAQSALEDLLKYGNAAAWFSEGVLKVGCYGDQTITGNGVTYTPDLTSVASLGPDDFIANGSSPPVTISRTSPADALNMMRVEYKDRANTYHDSVVMASIDEDVITNGGRADDSESVDMATTATVASQIAWNMLQRKFYVRNQYEFKLSWRYCYLEPFDIVDLTDANTGLNATPGRIVSVEEDEHGLLDIVAEECPEGIGHAATVATQGNSGTTVDPDADPGPVAGPHLFRGPGFLVGNNKPEIWCAVTGDGNPLWAGCDVYLSHDGASYTYLCSYARQARYGHITNSMSVQSDPDTVSAPNVVLNGNDTQLLGGSQADADQFMTLAMIDDEVVSYETATLASGPSYNLSYMRRGGYGTAIAAHTANAPFVRLDDGILRIPVDPSQIGQTIYLKFLSVNCFGRTPRSLSAETAYTYVIGSNVELPDVPVVPDNFTVTPVADGVSITWTNDNPAAVGCTSIEYATASAGPFTALAQVGPTTTGFPHHFATGATYYYRLRSRGPLVQSGWSAYTSVLSSKGKTVDDGATNGATIGPGGNVTGAVDPNGRAIIDFTQGGHLFKTIGNLGDDAAYSRTLTSRVNAGRPWIDFGETIHAHKHLGNMPDDAATSRFAVASIDGNRKALIDFTQGGHSGKNLDNIGDGGTYGRVFNARINAGRPTIDFSEAIHSNKTVDYIGDGGTYGRPLLSRLNAGRPTVNLAEAIHSNVTQDYVADGVSYSRSMGGFHSETVDNATFMLPIDPTGNVPGWAPVAVGVLTYSPAAAYNNANVLKITAAALGGAETTRKYACKGGDYVSVLADIFSFGNASATLEVRFYDKDGNSFTGGTGNINVSVTSTGVWQTLNAKGPAPANAAYFTILVFNPGTTSWQTFANNVRLSVNDVRVAGSGNYGYVNFADNTAGGHLGKNQDNIGAGATYGQTALTDLYTSGGVSRVGLRVGGSGQRLGDQTNTPSSLSRGYGAVRSAVALTAHSTGAVDVNAHTLTIGTAAISYSAHTNAVTGLSQGSTYYIYTRDNYAGGSPTVLSTTSAQTANSFDDAYIFGSVTIPASGDSGGGPSGGGGQCVGVNMFVRGSLRAKDVRRRNWLWMARRGRCFPGLQSERLTFSQQPCVRVVAEDGYELECSISTPFDLRDGSMTFARDMYGREVLTRDRFGRKRWRKVIDVVGIGLHPVAHIHAGGRSYAAGARKGHLIYSHNPVK